MQVNHENERAVIAVLPSTVVRVLLVCLAVLVFCGTLSAIIGPEARLVITRNLVEKFNLDGENNVPAWFSASCLLLSGLVLAVIAAAEAEKARRQSTQWLQLAVLMVLLSLDEAASFHEKLVRPVRVFIPTDGFLLSAWVIPGIAFACVCTVWFTQFALRLPRETRTAFIVSGIVYLSGALGMEMIGAKYNSLTGVMDLNFRLLVVGEEALEMLGVVMFLRALLTYLDRHIGPATIRWSGNRSDIQAQSVEVTESAALR